MDIGDLESILGTLAAIAALVGGAVVRERHIFKIIDEENRDMRAKLDTLSKSFVRRDELQTTIASMGREIADLKRTDAENNATLASRLDGLYELLLKLSSKK